MEAEEKEKEQEKEIPKPRKPAERKVPARKPRRMKRLPPEEAIKIIGKKPAERPMKVPVTPRRPSRRLLEPKFVEFKRMPRAREINEIMSLDMVSAVDKTLENGAREYAKWSLADVINRSNEKLGNPGLKFMKESPYIVQLENYLFQNSNTFRSYFRNMGSITVFLKNLSKYTLTFRNRLNNYFYTAEHLVTLTRAEKFPEVFQDTRVSQTDRDRVNERIDKDMSQVVTDAGNYLYQVRYPGARRPTRPLPVEMPLPFKLPASRLTQCENYSDVKEHEDQPWNIFVYISGGITYCFTIANLLQQFRQEDYTNPKTGERFSQDFIDKISRYSLERIIFGEEEEIEEEPELEVEEERVRKVVAPGLLDAILDDITRLEGGVSKFGSHNEEICNYCKKHVNADEMHKSIVYKGNRESEIVNFCEIKCFESWSIPKRKRF